MADEIVTRQQLVDAGLDAESLQKFISGTDIEDVLTRLGQIYPTLAKLVRILMETGGWKAYQTEAALLATTPTANPSVGYAFDTKKMYLWNGTSWINEGLSQYSQAVNFINEQFEALARIIGNLDGVSIGTIDDTGAALNNVPVGTYVLNKSVTGGVLQKVSIVSKFATGTATIKVFTLSNGTFTLARTIKSLNITKVGLNEYKDLNLNINAGEYLAFSVVSAGVVAYINKTSPTPTYYVDSNPDATSFAITGSNGGMTAALQIKFQQYPSLEPLAKILSDFDTQIENNTELLNYVAGTARYGIHQNPVYASTQMGLAQFIAAKAVEKAGRINKYYTYANVAGTLQIGAYLKSGKSFSRQRYQQVNVTVGLNIIDVDLLVNAGEYLGMRASVAGQCTYVAATTGHDGTYSTTSLEDTAVYSDPANMSYAFQFGFDQIYSKLNGDGGGDSSHWSGKTLATFGDSITWYDGQTFAQTHLEAGQLCKGYQSWVREMIGCIIDNHGQSGWDMTQIYNSQIKLFNFANTYATTITSGANDCRKGVKVYPTGESAPRAIGVTFDTTTYAGALQASIEYVISSNPACKIFLITPIRGWYNEYNTSNVPNTDPNVVGLMSEAYANAMKEIGKLYGIPVLDWFNDTGFNDLNDTYYYGDSASSPTPFTAYVLHPKNIGFKRMGEILAGFLSIN